MCKPASASLSYNTAQAVVSALLDDKHALADEMEKQLLSLEAIYTDCDIPAGHKDRLSGDLERLLATTKQVSSSSSAIVTHRVKLNP